MKLEFSRQFFEKGSSTKFLENPFSGSRVAPRGLTDRLKDMTKTTVAFRNFVNAPKNMIQSGRKLSHKSWTAGLCYWAIRVRILWDLKVTCLQSTGK